MSDALARGREILAKQSFSVLVGTELSALDADGVVLELPLRVDLRQQHGFAHGGIVSYLADNALTYAGAMAMGPVLGAAVVTLEMKINYLRPGVGERLIAKASVVSATRNFAVARCEVYARRDGQDVLCAAAQGTVAPIPPKDDR